MWMHLQILWEGLPICFWSFELAQILILWAKTRGVQQKFRRFPKLIFIEPNLKSLSLSIHGICQKKSATIVFEPKNSYFATFDNLWQKNLNGIKPLRSTFFSHFTIYFNISTHILFWIIHKVCKLVRKYMNLCVAFWKKYDTRKKFHVCLVCEATLSKSGEATQSCWDNWQEQFVWSNSCWFMQCGVLPLAIFWSWDLPFIIYSHKNKEQRTK